MKTEDDFWERTHPKGEFEYCPQSVHRLFPPQPCGYLSACLMVGERLVKARNNCGMAHLGDLYLGIPVAGGGSVL